MLMLEVNKNMLLSHSSAEILKNSLWAAYGHVIIPVDYNTLTFNHWMLQDTFHMIEALKHFGHFFEIYEKLKTLSKNEALINEESKMFSL